MNNSLVIYTFIDYLNKRKPVSVSIICNALFYGFAIFIISNGLCLFVAFVGINYEQQLQQQLLNEAPFNRHIFYVSMFS